MKEIILNVDKIKCVGCENRIKNSLKMLNEVKSVEASHISGKVKIKLNSNIEIDKIKNIINNLGFEVKN